MSRTCRYCGGRLDGVLRDAGAHLLCGDDSPPAETRPHVHAGGATHCRACRLTAQAGQEPAPADLVEHLDDEPTVPGQMHLFDL